MLHQNHSTNRVAEPAAKHPGGDLPDCWQSEYTILQERFSTLQQKYTDLHKKNIKLEQENEVLRHCWDKARLDIDKLQREYQLLQHPADDPGGDLRGVSSQAPHLNPKELNSNRPQTNRRQHDVRD